MPSLILPNRFKQQPQFAASVDGYWLSRGLKFALLPGAGYVNLVGGTAPTQTSTGMVKDVSVAGITYSGSSRAEYPLAIDATKGFTLISIWRARASGDYLGADASRTILSSRTAGNAGWSWGRLGAIGGGASGGNMTRQELVFQGVSAYSEANYTIEGPIDTPVAVRYSAVTGQISWFRFGRQSSSDTAASAPTNGGPMVFGAQGDYATNGNPWFDRACVMLAFQGALSDAEILALTGDVSAVWQVFKAPSRKLWFGVSSSSDVTIALTGQVIAASPGTFAPSASKALSGSSTTAVAGSVSAGSDVTVALSGQAATASAGTVTASCAMVLTGSSATASRGTLSGATSKAVTGQAATAAQGSVTVVGDITVVLMGQSMTMSQGVASAPSNSASESGGFYEVPRVGRHRSVQEDRERLGIIPKAVKAVLVAVAEASVSKEATDSQATGLLALALAAHDIQPARDFTQFMQQERGRILLSDIDKALRLRQKQYEIDEDEREAEMLLM